MTPDTVPILRVINLQVVPLNMEAGNIYGFVTAAINNHIYLYGGFDVKEYDVQKYNLYEFPTPIQNRHKVLKQSSSLYHIYVRNETIQVLHDQEEFDTANATMHIIERCEAGETERLLI